MPLWCEDKLHGVLRAKYLIEFLVVIQLFGFSVCHKPGYSRKHGKKGNKLVSSLNWSFLIVSQLVSFSVPH
uniref:Uncharacterized protein n=1 Tax=Arundo donax TaxID=35708 RepID=A0A0A9HS45_ARUDO